MEKNEGISQSQVEHFLQAVAQHLTLNKSKENEVSVEKKQEMFRAIASDQEALTAYIRSRADVILPLLPTQSTVRSIFKEDVMPRGVRQPSYPIASDYLQLAFVAPTIGGPVQRLVELDEIYVPPLMIDGAVEFLMRYAEDARYNVGETATNDLKNRIIAKEEFVGWRTVKAAISGVNAAQTIYTGGASSLGNLFGDLTLSGLNRMLTKMDQQQRRLTDVYLSPLRYGNIRDWTSTQIDYLTQREIYKMAGPMNGQVYDVALHKVYDPTFLGDGEVFGFDTRTFGVMPIITPLTTYQNPVSILEWKVGILAREEIGFAVMDPWAFVRLRLDND